MKNLFAIVNSIYPLSKELETYLELNLKRRVLKKKDVLLRQGQVCRNIYFVESGLLRCYYMKDEQDVSSWFMRENNFLISVESFYKQVPSYETIHAIEDSVLHYLDYNQLQHVYTTYPEFNFVGRVFTQEYYAMCEQRLFSLRMQKAADRYLHLLKTAPELCSRVPSQYLASYVGMRNETFSRIKAKYKSHLLTLRNFTELPGS
jgi:CRP-like cAMP-binding protein